MEEEKSINLEVSQHSLASNKLIQQKQEQSYVEEQIPLNIKLGIEQYGNEKGYLQMVQMFETQTLNSSIDQIHNQLLKENWPEVQHFSHNLKSTGGYVCANNISYLCNKLQFIIKPKMKELYVTDDETKAVPKCLILDLMEEKNVIEQAIIVMDQAIKLKHYISGVFKTTCDTKYINKYIEDIQKFSIEFLERQCQKVQFYYCELVMIEKEVPQNQPLFEVTNAGYIDEVEAEKVYKKFYSDVDFAQHFKKLQDDLIQSRVELQQQKLDMQKKQMCGCSCIIF